MVLSPRIIAAMLRRKPMEGDGTPSTLRRTLGFLSLTALGMGATLGSGVYVLWGVVARNTAGPAIVLSFAISGVASILSGLCYAEFGARVPRAGSAYVYSYVTVGEFLAWVTGWQLLLEYIIGASAVAVSWSGNLDALSGGAIRRGLTAALGGAWAPGLSSPPDVLAAAMTLLLSGVVCAGVRESAAVNNVLTAVNLAVVVFVIIVGLGHVRAENFTPFAPFGFAGVLKGAGTIFFSYVGFDVIATSAEEAIAPSKNIPASIIASLVLCAVAYIGVSGVVTLMVGAPALDLQAPLAAAFGAVGQGWARHFIEAGAFAGLTTSLMTCVFPMPRIVYAIAADGLLPEWMGRVHPRTGTPVVATLLCGGLAAFLALIFDISTLADMMSIGTLMAYSLVCASVLVLRYKEEEEGRGAGAGGAGAPGAAADTDGDDEGESEALPLKARAAAAAPLRRDGSGGALSRAREGLLASCGVSEGGGNGGGGGGGGGAARRARAAYTLWGMRPFAAASTTLAAFVLAVSVASGASVAATEDGGPRAGSAPFVALCVLSGIGLAVASAAAALLGRIPSSPPRGVAFAAPWCPWLPLAAIAVNIYLMASLNPLTWLRFGVWCALGLAIYFSYGMKHSKLGAASRAAEAAGAPVELAG
jgi:amino acid transporter